MSSSDLSYLSDINLQFGTYHLILNGKPVIYNGERPIKVEITSDFQANFFYSLTSEALGIKAKATSDDNGKVKNYVEKLMDSKTLYGDNLSGWFSPSQLSETLSQRMKAYPELNLLCYETQEYYALKLLVMSGDKDVTFKSNSTGEQMDPRRLRKLIDELRKSGFESMLELYRKGIARSAYYGRGIRRYQHVYTLAFLNIDGIFNPLWDDPEIKDSFFKTRLGKSIMRVKEEGTRRSQYAYLTHYELSEVLDVGGANNPRLLNFKFTMLIPLIAAYFLEDLDSRKYPMVNDDIWIKSAESELGDDYPRILNSKDYESLPSYIKSESENPHYLSRNSAVSYWMGFVPDFRHSGLSTRIISMEELIEVISTIKVG